MPNVGDTENFRQEYRVDPNGAAWNDPEYLVAEHEFPACLPNQGGRADEPCDVRAAD